MPEFSQINQTTKHKKCRGIQTSFEFKIQAPQNEKKPKEFIPQSSFFDQSEKSNSQIFKNTARSSYNDKLQQQYISYKLKPTNIKKDGRQVNNDYKINFHKKNHVWPQHKFVEPQIMESEKNSFAKSPEFVCKKASPINSQKQSFSGLLQQNLNLQNIQNSSFHPCKITKKVQVIKDDKTKKKQFDNFPQFKENREPVKKYSFNFTQNQDFQDYEVYTPYKNLKTGVGRQQKIFSDPKALDAYQFDSFNQQNFKENFIQFDQKHKLNFDNLNSFQKKLSCESQQQQYSLKNKIRSQIESQNSNKEFFFLTDPTLQQSEKQTEMTHRKDITKTSKQKEVREFCFNISQIKFQEETDREPYCNPNLFSNSNEYLMFFDSKDVPKEEICKNNSKRSHIRQMVEEFIQQLQHVDDKSLNEKVVSNLQNVLEQIVFKESKNKYDPIIIEDLKFTPKQENQDQIKSMYNETKFKKWTKPKRNPNLSPISSIRQKYSEIKDQNHLIISQSYQQNLSPNSRIPSNYFPQKKRDQFSMTERNDITNKSNKKPGVYKPNFDFDDSKNVHRKHSQRLKSESSPPKNLMFTKHKQIESTEIKINPKSSIYFNNKKNSLQNLKTENSRKSWRVY